MSVLLWPALAWLLLASVAAVIGGTAIRLADERDAAHRRQWQAESELCGSPVDIPADTRERVPSPL